MAITIIVTNAGRAALVNAANTGTNAVTITQLGITAAVFAPNAAQVALPGEIKRIASVAGVVVADDQIHVTASDVTTDAYAMRGFGLYLADGTLFAIYGQAGEILNKTSESMMLLAADIAFADIDAEMIEFGDTNFVLPPATTEVLGLVELATTAEAQTGSDATRVLTPLTGKQSVLGWLLSQDGSGSGLDADMLDGLHASAFAAAGHVHGTMANQNADNVNIIGGVINGTAIGTVAAAPASFTTLSTAGDARFGFAGGPLIYNVGFYGRSPEAGTIDWDIRTNDASYGARTPITIKANGNVGLGLTAPAAKLHVAGDLMVGNAGQPGIYNIGFFGRAPAGGTIDWDIRTADATFGARTAMTIAANGSLGIGTTSPQARVDIAATNPVRGIVSVVRNPALAGQNGCQLEFTQSAIANWTIGQPAGVDAFAFFAGRSTGSDGTEVFRIANNGNLTTIGSATIGNGTGTRSVTFATSRSYLTIEADGATNAAGSTIYYSWSGGGQGPLKFNNSAGEVMRLSGNANVGIGVNDPQFRLHVRSVSELARFDTATVRGSGNGFIGIGDPTGRKGWWGYGGANDTIYMMNDMNANLVLGTGGQSRLTLDTSGNLTPISHGAQILGWPTAAWKEGHFSDFVRVAGNNAWHSGNDGAGSGLDADLLDGLNSSAFLQLANFIGSEILSRLVTVDGSGSGLDADLLDGYHASSFDRIVEQNLTAEGGYIVYASGRKECWGTVVIGQDSYATWNLPVAHTSWCHPSFTYTGKAGVNNTADNTMFVGFLGAPPYATRWYNAEDATLTIYVRTIGV